MNQSRLESFIEAWANVVIGFAINFVANILILPRFGCPMAAAVAFNIGLAYTVISVVRSYAIRRFFNTYLHRFSRAVARLVLRRT